MSITESTTTSNSLLASAPSNSLIDPRGPQFGAAITAVVLAAVLLVAPAPIGLALLGAQVVLFAIGAIAGVQRTPYAGPPRGRLLFRRVVRPRLSAPTELEDAAAPRFAQGVGLAFALVGLIGFLAGATLLAQIAIGFALLAALLNAAFAFCLGCEVYLLLRRVTA